MSNQVCVCVQVARYLRYACIYQKYLTIYIYICVCVCVCVYFQVARYLGYVCIQQKYLTKIYICFRQHAETPDMAICTHFEDKNVFSHFMPSKVTTTLIYTSKTTMSSVIACLQRRQRPHLHFEDDNVFNHCMPSKGDNVFVCILKTTMSLP